MINLEQLEETICSCDTCVTMCKTAPCLGTPEDIKAILDAGFKESLRPTMMAAPQILMYFGRPIEVVTLDFNEEKGQCCMLDDNNKCKLHDLGLKPTEGKLADCKVDRTTATISPAIEVLKTWIH